MFIRVSILLLLILANIIIGSGQDAIAPTNGCGTEDYAAKIKVLTERIKTEPANYKYYLERGEAYAGIYDHVSALKDLNRARELQPGSYRVAMAIGIIYADRNKYAEAIAEFSKATEIDPTIPEAYFERANIRSDDPSFDQQSLADLTKAITFNSKSASYYYVRASIENRIGRKQEAADDWSRAEQILTGKLEGLVEDQCKSHIYVQRGWVNEQRGNIVRAASDYNSAIEIENNYFLARYYRGRFLVKQKQYGAAISDFNKAIELNPNFADLYRFRAWAYDKLGAKNLAEADLRKVEELKQIK